MTTKTIHLNQKISIEEAKASLVRSGYLLESRVETALRQARYLVETNVLYDDPITGKKREIDLIASTGAALKKYIDEPNYQPSSSLQAVSGLSKENMILSGLSKESMMELDSTLGDISIELIVECINNPQPLAFIKNPIRSGDDYIQDIYTDIRGSKVAGRPQKFQNSRHRKLPLTLENFTSGALRTIKIEDFYTQYCSFKIKKDPKPLEWMAYHDDVHHDSFNALCLVVNQRLSEANEFYSSPSKFRDLSIHLCVPVLIVQNDLWVISEQTDREIEIEEVEHVCYFRASSSSVKSPTGYHIDVIRESYLEQYLKDVVDKSLQEIQSYCFNNIVEDDEGLKFHFNHSKKEANNGSFS